GLHGDWAAPFHLANALVMGGIALAARALLRAPGLGLGAAGATWAAAAFALHPIASETSFPIASGRETALPVLFVLLAMAAWLRGRRALALAAGAAALWSKEQAIVLPALVALADALRLGADPPGPRVRAWAVRLAPWLALVVLYLLVRRAIVPPSGDPPGTLWAWIAAHPFAPLASGLYLVQSAFAPTAALLYEPRLEVWLSVPRAALALVTFAAVLAAALARGPRAAVAFWVGWMPLGMAFHLGWLPVEVQFSERYLVLSSLALAALVALAGGGLAARGPSWRPALAAAGAAVLILLAVLTVQRAGAYRDELAFTRRWVASDPAHANAQASLGAVLARHGRDDEALAALREAVRLEPRLAAAWYNQGVLLARNGRLDEAREAFAACLRADANDADAHYALGVLLARRGERADAEAHLRRALALRPGFGEARAALAELTERPAPR
ncbi:MAG TPA: tetratricopeptide repeat protein, partial [Myxococcota bacterium]